jgi:SWI/SNF-related matrix-associated actin-dependent regulator 1 of chromatin subfamily A
MDLQDALKSSNWDMLGASEKLRPQSPKTKHVHNKGGKKKASVKRHETREPMSESDDEGEYDDNGLVFDSSDSEEEADISNDKNLSGDKKKVFEFFCNGTEQELAGIQGCSKKKVQMLVELRPFEGWSDLVRKIQLSKSLSTDMLNHTTGLLRMRDAVAKLMERCEKITKRMENMVENLTNSAAAGTKLEVSSQPKNLTAGFTLTGYQMIGLNWLVLMHRQNVNGILADEMGLGKTIQSIAFLAHLKEMGDEGPHLIIVPSSTMENWQKELALWCPDLKVLNYYGSQDERRHMRLQIVQEAVQFDIILTTYNMVISSADDRVLFRKLEFHYVIFDEAHMLKNMNMSRYENLMRVQASRKLLLTGTPLQNNLVELMSLLVFVMPDMFANKKEQLKKMFMLFPVSNT